MLCYLGARMDGFSLIYVIVIRSCPRKCNLLMEALPSYFGLAGYIYRLASTLSRSSFLDFCHSTQTINDRITQAGEEIK